VVDEGDAPPGARAEARAVLVPHAIAGDDFEEFFRHYPRQENKKAAAAEFARVMASGEITAPELIAATMRYAAERDGENPKFTLLPVTFLRDARWTDGPRPKGNGDARPQRGGRKDYRAIALRHGGFDVPKDWQQ
jgi:hypothetical protein